MASVILSLLFFAALCCQAVGQGVSTTRVRVNGVDLHYVERGRGEPLILLHGGQGHYRSWGAQVEALSPHYRGDRCVGVFG
jgi:hypothetical protein